MALKASKVIKSDSFHEWSYIFIGNLSSWILVYQKWIRLPLKNLNEKFSEVNTIEKVIDLIKSSK